MRAGLWVSWIAVATAVGCAQPAANGCRTAGGHPTSDALDVVPRETRTLDIAQVGSAVQVDKTLGYPRTAGNYHALGPAECQCMAARASKLGNLFDGERRALAAGDSSGRCSHTDNSLTFDVLRTAALEARNRSAGDALNSYYLLAQNEARLDLLTRALGETRQAVSNVDRLRQQGLKMPADDDRFARRDIELRDQLAQVEAGVSQLNGQLWQLIGIWPAAPQERTWPTAALAVTVERQDVEAAVQLGLGTRPELGMLRRMRSRLDEDSLSGARAAMKQVNPLLGLTAPSSDCDGPLGFLGKLRKLHAAKEELPERRRQLNQYTIEREQEVAVEIRQAAETVELRLRQIALAKEALALAEHQRLDAEGRSNTGRATFADVAVARLAVVQADEDLLEKIVAWKIAEARLKQAQGMLVTECCP